VGKVGGQIGPPLDDVGRRLPRAEILQSMLQPSLKIDPRYTTWTVLTDEGKVVSGLLLKKTDQHVLLRTPQGKDKQIDRSAIEELIPQTTSLMPDRLLNDLTDQQIADLLAWLGDQRAELQPTGAD
jgi:putative heme-binding domain-containing protein